MRNGSNNVKRKAWKEIFAERFSIFLHFSFQSSSICICCWLISFITQLARHSTHASHCVSGCLRDETRYYGDAQGRRKELSAAPVLRMSLGAMFFGILSHNEGSLVGTMRIILFHFLWFSFRRFFSLLSYKMFLPTEMKKKITPHVGGKCRYGLPNGGIEISSANVNRRGLNKENHFCRFRQHGTRKMEVF